MSRPGPLPAPAPSPVDQEDRDAVSFDLASTIFAVAGAGSGKTRHLVDRVVHIVVSGTATIDQLAAITFTEAAAAELRDRIGEALEAAVDGGGVGAQRALAALSGLQSAAITTLHGFARRVLADHPFEAGLPPIFEVLDEARSIAELDGQWTASIEALAGGPLTGRALQWAIACGGSLDAFHRIARQLGGNWDRVAAPVAPAVLPRIDAVAVLGPLRRAVAAGADCADPDDSLATHLGRLAPLAQRLSDARSDELELLRLLARPPCPLGGGTRGKAGNWGGRKPEVLGLLAAAEAARQAVVGPAADAALRILGAALGDLAVAAAHRRRREGRLEYHDLLVLARDVVRDHPPVRHALHAQYRFVMVDEFQDTDPLQAELVVLIAAEPGVAVGGVPWDEVPTVPGKLFFVGDPHQSIYRFRRADIETFTRAGSRVATRTARLVSNFRSVPGIVRWVDAVFAELMGGTVDAGQPAFVPSVPARPTRSEAGTGCAPAAAAVGCPVTVLGAGGPVAERARDVRRAEAEDVVATLARAIDEGWPIGDEQRPVQPSDITVLIPTRVSLRSLQEALDGAGLAYRLQSSSLVYVAAEVQDLLSVLAAVDDPADEAAVVTALRTPGFGCGDDDLVRHRLAGGCWDYRRAAAGPAPGDDPVRRGLAELRRLHDARAWTPVSQLVARVVEERRFLAAALDGDRWREEWRRLRFVVDQARRFTESSAGDLRQYLRWVDMQRAEDARVTEVVLPEADVDAVSVMTVHAAKGLEFPVVALVGFGALPRPFGGPAVLFGRDGPELGLRAGLRTAGFEALCRRETALDAHERLRLLYVAVTRAQDHLVVSVHRAAKATTSTAARLEEALPPAGGLWRAGRSGEPPSRPRMMAAGPRPPCPGAGAVGAPGDLERWVAEREVRRRQPPAVIAATGMASLARAARAAGAGDQPPDEAGERERQALSEDHEPDATTPEAAARHLRRGRAGTAAGRAVHAVLQSVDLVTGEGIDRLSAAYASAEGIAAQAGEVARMARLALATDVVRGAASGRHWRELYVGAPVGSRVLEGFVDLLVDGPDGLEVVDYKTDRIAHDEDVDQLVARYRLQGAAYARTVEAAVGRPVRRCTFVFLRGDSAVSRTVDDLPQAIADVERLLGAPHAEVGSHRGLPGERSVEIQAAFGAHSADSQLNGAE